MTLFSYFIEEEAEAPSTESQLWAVVLEGILGPEELGWSCLPALRFLGHWTALGWQHQERGAPTEWWGGTCPLPAVLGASVSSSVEWGKNSPYWVVLRMSQTPTGPAHRGATNISFLL